MEYLNFDLEIHPRREDVYPVAARSEAGEARHLMRFPWEEAALDTTLLRVENALLRTGHVRRGTGTPEEQVVQHFGQTLFEALLAEEVRRLYDRSAAQAAQQGKGVRLRLQIQAPELAVLPWEFLYDPLQRDYLCFLPDTVIVRYLEMAHPLPPFQVDPPLRVLAMIAHPTDQDQLDVTREQQRLGEALLPLEQRGLVKLHWVEGQTVAALHHALLQRPWHIFHYIGHGGFDPRSQQGVLALVNEQGKSHLLSATDLGRLLERRASLRLVVLNACQGAVGSKQDRFSSTAATLASKRIPAVLAMQYDISDQAAVQFTRGFYEALAVGLPVEEAVTEARTAISVGTAKTLEWVTPVLYLRAPTGLLFMVPRRESSAIWLPKPQDTPGEAPGAEPAQRPASPLSATSSGRAESGADPEIAAETAAADGGPLVEDTPPPLVGSAPVFEGQTAVEPPREATDVLVGTAPELVVPPSSAPSPGGLSRRVVLIGFGATGLAVAGGSLLWWVRSAPTPSRPSPFIFRGHTDTVNAVAWSPNGTRIASASGDSTVQVWDAKDGSHLFTYRKHAVGVYAVAWSPDGTRLASAGADGLQVWEASHGRQIFVDGPASPVLAVAWSLDGTWIASAGGDGTVHVLDPRDGSTVFTYRGHTPYASLRAVAWSPHGTQIASAGDDETVQVWDAKDGSHVFTYWGHSSGVLAVAWAPNGTRLASASIDATVQVWDANDGTNVFTYRDHPHAVNAVAWAPDGKHLASASDDIQVWEASYDTNVLTYRGHTAAVNAVTWSPDGTRLASASADHTVQVWEPT